MLNSVKKGDIVARMSYSKDVIFIVDSIIDNKIAILTGITTRLKADSPIEDLEHINKMEMTNIYKTIDEKIDKIIHTREIIKNDISKRSDKIICTGKILHLDGDKKYSEKSYRYYKKIGLQAIVKNVPEYKQPKVVYNLLKLYNPDILVITGHDGMIKKATRYNDLYNYKNSKYFIETVKEARRYDIENKKNLVIFAGACQSYFEAIMCAGANFASSPGRILIDFMDPLIVAEKVAVTEKYKYITIEDIEHELRDGKKGVSGIGANGKMHKCTKI